MRILLAPLFLFPALAFAQQQPSLIPDLLRPLKDAGKQRLLQHNFSQLSPSFTDSDLQRALKGLQVRPARQLLSASELNGRSVCSVPLQEMQIPKDRDFTMRVIPIEKTPDGGADTVKPLAPPCGQAASEHNILFPQERR